MLYQAGVLTQGSARVLWQRDLQNFATGITAADGKVYTIDIWGNVNCYDSQSGKSIWSGSIGAYWGAGLAVSENNVYGGKASAEVGALDKVTGEFQWSFQVPAGSQWTKRAPADITVADGRVFATADGVGVHNAVTGELLWEYPDYSNLSEPYTWWVRAYPLEDNLVYAESGGPSGVHTYRLDPDNGNVLWRVNGTFFSGRPVAYQGQVIVQIYTVVEENYSQKMEVVSLNESTGSRLWSYDVRAEIYQPTFTYGDLLFFGASDGNFYALNLTNGTLEWKTRVDSQNLLGIVNPDNSL
ncbi:MAG TPA: PQQ-binding-like beta-propeller repeat protein, partial [Candidatus Bathyarchaeia archaeon]|nr:PQQ-binding-like beta-propeller repeat protein [Candidatus Bathyarchaeia archaeon]